MTRPASPRSPVYGGGFALDLQPPFPSPGRALRRLPHVLHGDYNPRALGELIAWSAGVSFAVSLVGLFWFGRRDV
jgi:hypothetical protein